MHVILARNVNDAYAQGVQLIMDLGVPRGSRYGPVLEVPEPVTTVYREPCERVLFDTHRDINPFFHLFEALWILEGRNDVEWVAQFASKMREFSDDGETFHGAYGRRLRHWDEDSDIHFSLIIDPDIDGMDQLEAVVALLRRDPETRRAVVCLYDPRRDLGANSKDIPCNDTIKFESRDGILNIIVFCRSNDMIWGAYGTNAVQFGFLLEYVAGMSGLKVGSYTQISCNYHVYTAVWEKLRPWEHVNGRGSMPNGRWTLPTYPLITNSVAFDEELHAFFEWAEADSPTERTWLNGFFPNVAMPLYLAWYHHKTLKDTETAIRLASKCKAADWNTACVAWLQRRLNRRNAQ